MESSKNKNPNSLHVITLACILGCLLALQGCGGFATRVEIPKEVKVIVAVPCVKKSDLPTRPELRSDDEILALDRFKRTIAMWGERLDREDYEAKMAAVLAACASKE